MLSQDINNNSFLLKKQSLVETYFEYHLKYEKIYGKKTLILMEVGSFYELYGVNNKIEKIGDVQSVTEILNIQMIFHII